MPDNPDTGALAPLVLIVGSLVIVLDLHPGIVKSNLPEPIVIVVPVILHAFAIIAGICFGIYAKQPVLALIGVVMLLVGILVHLLPWWVSHYRPQQLEA